MQSRRPLMPYSLVLTFIFDFDNYIPAVLKKGDLKNYYQKLRNSACKTKKNKKTITNKILFIYYKDKD